VVDAGLDQVHGPGPPERMRRDLQAGSPAGVTRPDGPHVAGQEPGDPGPCQSGVVRPGEQRVGARRCRRPGRAGRCPGRRVRWPCRVRRAAF